MMQKVLDWLTANQANQVQDLAKLVAIPSISTDGEHAKEIEQSAALTCELMRAAGLQNIDILRTGNKLTEMKRMLEAAGATVVGLAVVIYQPTPNTADFGSLPLYYLAKLDASYYADSEHCELCKQESRS